MQSFEEAKGQAPAEQTTFSTRLALAAGALLVLALVAMLAVSGAYVDVEQADVSQATAPTAVAHR